MSISITWSIEKLECYQQVADQPDVVCNIHWRVDATDGTYSAVSQGSNSIAYSEGSPFTPYSELNEDQVIGWVKSSLGLGEIATIEGSAKQNVMSQPLPVVFTPDLPWGTSTK
jgi:hypothetical protein